MLKKGVYTAECPKCSRSILMHVLSDGSVSPHKCSKCELELAGIDNGEQRNTFVAVVKKAEVKEVEEKPKAKKITVKTQKDSFKMWKDR